jgi:hypothetical protein
VADRGERRGVGARPRDDARRVARHDEDDRERDAGRAEQDHDGPAEPAREIAHVRLRAHAGARRQSSAAAAPSTTTVVPVTKSLPSSRKRTAARRRRRARGGRAGCRRHGRAVVAGVRVDRSSTGPGATQLTWTCGCELARERARQRHDARLGDVVRQVPGMRAVGGDVGEVDDLPRAARPHGAAERSARR